MSANLIVGGGCFWCTEAVFQRVKGVLSVTSGYTGGNTENPSYADICSGVTNHAEVVSVDYDASQISLKELLKVFWFSHDPTTLNQQGNDVGTQYRSVIYFQNEEERTVAEFSKEEHQSFFTNPIVTKIEPLETFWSAEIEHQNYYNRHPSQGYCQIMIAPKIYKLGELGVLKDGSDG